MPSLSVRNEDETLLKLTRLTQLYLNTMANMGHADRSASNGVLHGTGRPCNRDLCLLLCGDPGL